MVLPNTKATLRLTFVLAAVPSLAFEGTRIVNHMPCTPASVKLNYRRRNYYHHRRRQEEEEGIVFPATTTTTISIAAATTTTTIPRISLLSINH